jgi:hypothetical protein
MCVACELTVSNATLTQRKRSSLVHSALRCTVSAICGDLCGRAGPYLNIIFLYKFEKEKDFPHNIEVSAASVASLRVKS